MNLKETINVAAGLHQMESYRSPDGGMMLDAEITICSCRLTISGGKNAASVCIEPEWLTDNDDAKWTGRLVLGTRTYNSPMAMEWVAMLEKHAADALGRHGGSLNEERA